VAMVEWVGERSKKREEKRRSQWMLGCRGGGEEEEERGEGTTRVRVNFALIPC